MKGPHPSLFVLCTLLLIVLVTGEGNESSEENNFHEDTPRVKIKVFRGEFKEENGETYAPWGFWIKQPSQK
ncbi:hypothetical protein TSAR_013105 [Trichomalopsis sarcophagae]|uniref:Secreted protein n=1 Tax=Trichomalopsis sarcophagae TaxID=543379 RepID=A0A232F0P6_9HYME|nr:hypothetical protein TSAR_013105 [Trichomalopsis sarcophagae]